MTTDRPCLTLAHSPDPDDVFMWWPITGKIDPRSGEVVAPPVIDTGRFEYRAVPADIDVLNRRAISGQASELYDITAISFRAYADAASRYALTACGSSFGDGYGPKVVAPPSPPAGGVKIGCDGCLKKPGVRFAVPGVRTTAFLLMGMVMGTEAVRRAIDEGRVREMGFERVIPAVASGEADAGLVIHEGQVTFADAGLKMVVDVGAWWKEKTGLPLPLGANVVRRDLEGRYGAGTMAEVERTLRASIEYAIEHRQESLEYALPFALANVDRGGDQRERPTLERVARYVDMYVNRWTRDMGADGVSALRRLFDAGTAAGLCPAVGELDVVGIAARG